MAKNVMPDAEYLRKLFQYNPETGDLIWRVRPRGHFQDDASWKRWNTRYAGSVAGTKNVYTKVSINKYIFGSHRIIWVMQTGNLPSQTIDHRDRAGVNNRWGNLREATVSQQNCNRILPSATGLKGVTAEPNGRWRAQIRVGKKMRYLGLFQTKEAAHSAWGKAAAILHGEFSVTVSQSR